MKIIACEICGARFYNEREQRSEKDGQEIRVNECPFCGTRHYEVGNGKHDNTHHGN